MKPYYSDDLVTLYHGDCRDILPLLGRFDLLHTDPPYGINAVSNGRIGGGGKTSSKRRQWKAEQWDDATAPVALSLALSVCAQAIVWGGNYYDLPPTKCWLVWDKGVRNFSLADGEMAWTNLDKSMRILTIPRSPALYRAQWHPTGKPLELVRWAIAHASLVASVLDPFAGSGTTLRAAKDAGIRSVGIELSEAHCEVAADMCRQEVLDLGGAA